MHAPWRRGGRATESRGERGPRRVEWSRGAARNRVCACAHDQTVCTLLARAARRARALANMSERIGPPPPPPPRPRPPRSIFATSFIGVESENQSFVQAPCNCTSNGAQRGRHVASLPRSRFVEKFRGSRGLLGFRNFPLGCCTL